MSAVHSAEVPTSSLRVRVLGCSGAISSGNRTTAFLVGRHLLVDAGTGVGDLTLEEMADIRSVVLTHSHLDHIAALPLMLDAVGSRRTRPLQVFALAETISALRSHLFNGVIWPDFERLPSPDAPFVQFRAVHTGQRLHIDNVQVEALPAAHTVPALGYAVSTGGEKAPHWVFSGDTGHNPAFWQRVNQLPVGMLVMETAFSEREAGLAAISQHLCPSALATQLALMDPGMDCPVYITHTKPAESELIMQEIMQLNAQRVAAGLRPHAFAWLYTGQELTL